MKHLNIVSLWIFAFVTTSMLPQSRVRADVAAPYAQFNFKFQGGPIAIVNADLVSCNDDTCAQNQSKKAAGSCYQTTCNFVLPDLHTYRKLVVQFADQTRESNVFPLGRAYAVYTVTVSSSALDVEEDQAAEATIDLGHLEENFGFIFPLAVVITIAVDTLVAWVYIRIFKLPRHLLLWVAVLPIFTLPVVWFGFLRLPLPIGWTLLIAEGCVFLFEALFLYWRGGKNLTAGHALILSLVVNITSFGLGLMLLSS